MNPWRAIAPKAAIVTDRARASICRNEREVLQPSLRGVPAQTLFSPTELVVNCRFWQYRCRDVVRQTPTGTSCA